MSAKVMVSFKQLKPVLGIDYSRTHIDRKEKAGTFPKSFKLGSSRYSKRMWFLVEVVNWIEDCAKTRQPDGSDDT
jgi:predicted DNA-binding transcriptional regulator AlpA